MEENEFNLNDDKEPNLIIISKPGVNSTRNNHSYLTLKEGDYSLKIDIDNKNTKIDQQKIFQTVSDLRRHIEGKKNRKNSTKNRLTKHHKVNKIIRKEINDKIISEQINNDDTRINNKNREFSSIIIANENKLTENDKDIVKINKENLKEIEENFASSINKKSVITQLNKKDRQKSIQQSDKAEISKVNSDSDNVTEFDNKIKLVVKYRIDNGQSIKCDINEKEEIENELIDNEKDLITVLNNDNNKNTDIKKKNVEKEEKIIFKKDTISIKQNNFIEQEKNEISKNANINNKIKDIDKDKNNNKENNINLIDISNDNNNDKENNLIEINKNNKNSNDNSMGNDNISERKNLMPLISPSIVKKNNFVEKNKKIETNIIQINPIIIVNQENLKNTINSNLMSSNRELKINESRTYYQRIQFTQKNCYICEKAFYLSRLYCADCGIHFLCRKCIKNYYEDYIENKNNNKILKCPCIKCEKTISYDILKTIISESHQQMYELDLDENKLLNKNNGLFNNMKLSSNKINNNNVKMYSEKHVLDINSNMNFFMYKKSKDIFCPKCLNPDLFSKTNNHFIKCLNCDYKICKYCLKEYTFKHLDMKIEGYCKVHYRNIVEPNKEQTFILIYLLQLFFVIAMYFLTYFGAYLFFYSIFKCIFRLNTKNKNFLFYIKKFFAIIFSFILFFISCPFIVICYPFFPSLISLCDFSS